MSNVNRVYLLARRPKGMPVQEDFLLETRKLRSIEDGEILIKTHYLSVDPYMRGRMNGVKTYVDPFELNEPLTGGVIGEVIDSKNERFLIGDMIEGSLDWADYSISSGKGIRKLENYGEVSLTTALGITGMPGLTAYCGLMNIGKPQEGETIVISGAAGAVGSIVGQIAKLKGLKVVGIAGSEEKCRWLKEELGFDAALNYKEESFYQNLKEACLNGVDIYFDNVGGEVSDAVMRRINYKARIPLCGQISMYNAESLPMGPRVGGQLVTKSALMQGFIVSDYRSQFREASAQLISWVKEGKLTYKETVIEGLENAPNAFIGLFKGVNIGKQLVKVI